MTAGGLPAHSFQGLLGHLATVTRMQVAPKSETAATFGMLSQPTPVRKEAFRLPGLRIS